MVIVAEIPDDFFSEDEEKKLRSLLSATTGEEFGEAIGKVLMAALTEYKEMLLGKGLPTRADEIQQHRLFHLVKHYFGGRIPTEAEVSSMFQLTESESKSLIRNVRTRFRFQLEQEIHSTLRATVASAEQAGEEYKVVIQSNNILEELNMIIGVNRPGYDPITKIKNCARKYRISEDSYDFLREYLGIPEGEEATE
ncbi:MAG: hypothetical protein U1D96_01215 [Eubacteriales bacterium]|nr:hypothetical protein [Bacillota bacterium]MDP3051823.1 hypothetical protein [Eubacteriales bacterium]MDZ4042105.1 hypothetical protein [Eubacteriales bacterium]